MFGVFAKVLKWGSTSNTSALRLASISDYEIILSVTSTQLTRKMVDNNNRAQMGCNVLNFVFYTI